MSWLEFLGRFGCLPPETRHSPHHEFLKEAFHGFRRRLGVLLGLQRAAVARDVAEVEVRRQSRQRLGLSRVVAGLVQLEAAAEEVVQGHRRRPLARDRPRHLGHRLASLRAEALGFNSGEMFDTWKEGKSIEIGTLSKASRQWQW